MRELDELPWEARLSTATSFRLWPKVDGVNVAAEADPTFTVHDPNGLQIASGTGVVEDRGDYDSIRCDLSAIATLDEDYSIRVTWSEEGSSDPQLYVRLFDVVRYPFGQPSTSLNDLLEERPDCGYELERIGPLLDAVEGDAAYAAGVMAVRARVELEAMVRNAVRDAATSTSTSTTRPNLILNRERLARVERALAMAALYESISDDPSGESEKSNDKLAAFYRAKAASAWANLGPLKFDTSDEQLRVAEVVTDSQRRVTFTHRGQG